MKGRVRACLLAVVGFACAPNVPTGVTAKAGQRSAQVTWTAPQPRLLAAVTRSTIQADPGGMSVTVDAASTNASFANLMNGVGYRFTVTATNWRGDGPPSAPSAAVTPAAPPGAPTEVKVEHTDYDARSMFVTWKPPAENGGVPITGYTVKATPDQRFRVLTSSLAMPVSVTAVEAHANVSGVAVTVPYRVTVSATNAAGSGLESEASTPAELGCAILDPVFAANGADDTAPGNESESDSTEPPDPIFVEMDVSVERCDLTPCSAVTSVKKSIDDASLYRIALKRAGLPTACQARGTVNGNWGSETAHFTFPFPHGWRYEGEFAQFDGEGGSPDLVSQKLTFGAPVDDKEVREILKACECAVESVDKDATGLPSTYHCRSRSDEVTVSKRMFSAVRDGQHRVIALSDLRGD